jgi:hypothetical protein
MTDASHLTDGGDAEQWTTRNRTAARAAQDFERHSGVDTGLAQQLAAELDERSGQLKAIVRSYELGRDGNRAVPRHLAVALC